jgi:hypothetical protein
MTEGNQPGGGHLNREDEPIRLKRDSDLSPEPVKSAHTPQQEWHRHGNEPTAYIPQDDEKPLPPQKPPTILDVFRFPFSLSGIIHFLIFWLGPFLLAFFARFLGLFFYGQFAIYGANTILYGYLLFYLSSCVIASAKDERFAPDITFEDTPHFLDLLGRLFLIFGCTLLSFAPVILYVFYFYLWPTVRLFWGRSPEPADWRADPVYWLLYGFGDFLYPMFILAVAMFNSAVALNPVLIISSIISTLVPYCALALLFFGIGLLINYLVGIMNGWVPAFFVWGVVVYLMFIASYILGRFFRRYEDRLNWEVKL